MALQKSWDDDFGSTHASAYGRVLNVELDVAGERAFVKAGVYVNAAARNAGKDPFKVMTYLFDADSTPSYADLFGVSVMDTKNPIQATYDHIKTLDEWSGATDV